ncbi:MAG: DNA mismatch repair endonuclease MutL [Dehalococcoidia bacterium]|nr:DNA mismatch repair endonuclease MutL [Dehalococcoidia bacterium]
MPIKVLSPEVVAKIAAGEVVERPASVVKELVENALDAGAGEISVEIQNGGVALIRVSDNGMGIPPAEASLSFQRHATSKIAGMQDLENISSLGFRGEALASIASVAQVEMLTRIQSEDAGLYLVVKNGIMIERSPRVRTPGTTITVRNLFSTIPARLKFLKSPATENSHVSNTIQHYALAYPEVKFSLFIEGRRSLQTPGSGKLRECIIAVYGHEFGEAMLETVAEDSPGDNGIGVSGFVSPPALSRSNYNYISFFINRRWARSRALTFAVEEAYRGMLMTGKHPAAVLNISLPFPEVDVNVHPTKMEVRFRNEPAVFSMVQKKVRKTLLQQSPVPETAAGRTSIPTEEPVQALWESLNRDSIPTERKAAGTSGQNIVRSELPILRVLGQLSNTYVIAEGPQGLYLIDQHAAHERVIYDDLINQRKAREVISQGMLQPLTLELNAGQDEIMKEKGQELPGFGFTLEPFGERTYLVRTVPSVLKDGNISETLMGVIDDLAKGEAKAGWEELIAASIACHGAVKAGQVLSGEELTKLVRRLEKSDSPRTCPHGRPTMLHLSADKLEREFGRR